MTALFANPSTGGAVTLILTIPPSRLVISFLEDLGIIFASISIKAVSASLFFITNTFGKDQVYIQVELLISVV
jgi:hypothetical protein